LSSTAAALRNCSGKNADSFRVFEMEALNRQRGSVRGPPRWPHHRWARPGARPRPLVVSLPLAPLRLSFGPRPSSRKNRSFGLQFVQFREYFLCSFSKTAKTGNWHCGILSIGLFWKSHKNDTKCKQNMKQMV
jgi:hypothetical protein